MAERRTSRLSEGQATLPFLPLAPPAPQPLANRSERRPTSANNGDAAQLLTVRQVCDRLQCSRTYAYGLLQRGQLRAVKLGRLTRIPLHTLEEFIAHKVADAQYDVCERWSLGGDRDAM
jgi:excisionase family DNA binding protein